MFDDPFERYRYPLTTADAIAAHGGDVLQLAGGTETLAEVLAPIAVERFEDADDLRTTVYGAVSSKGVGRKFYTDRESSPQGTYGPEPVSF